EWIEFGERALGEWPPDREAAPFERLDAARDPRNRSDPFVVTCHCFLLVPHLSLQTGFSRSTELFKQPNERHSLVRVEHFGQPFHVRCVTGIGFLDELASTGG